MYEVLFSMFLNSFLAFQLMVYNDGELVNGCPYYFRVLPPLTKIKSPGMDPCAIGSIVEVLVNSYGTSFRYEKIRFQRTKSECWNSAFRN